MLLSIPADTDNEPNTSTLVPVFLTCNMFAVPPTVTLNGPLASSLASLVPFSIYEPVDTDMFDRPPPSPVINPVVVRFHVHCTSYS